MAIVGIRYKKNNNRNVQVSHGKKNFPAVFICGYQFFGSLK